MQGAVSGLWWMVGIPTDHTSPQCMFTVSECTGLVCIPHLWFGIARHTCNDTLRSEAMSLCPLTITQPTDCEAICHPMQSCIFVTVAWNYKWIAANVNSYIWIVKDISSTEAATEMQWCIINDILHCILVPDNVIYCDTFYSAVMLYMHKTTEMVKKFIKWK